LKRPEELSFIRKDLLQKMLRELLKNSKQSDRELAKILEVSQPTITRTRHKLEQDGMIKDYTIIPDFRKMGFEILALTFAKVSSGLFTPKEMRKKAEEYAEKVPYVVFVSSGEGLGMNMVILAFHKSYTDFHHTLNQVRFDWKDYLQDVQSFTVSLGEGELKRFSLAHLKDVPL